MITCTKCKQEKEASEFPAEPTKKNGLHSWCKTCRSEYTQAYYKDYYMRNKEKCDKRHKEYIKRIKEEKKLNQ